MNPQGWFIRPNGEFLFWAPPYLRPFSLITDMLVIPLPRVDVSRFIHGQEWYKIRDANLSISWPSCGLKFEEIVII